MKYNSLIDELQIATQLAFSQSANDRTADSFCTNTTGKSKVEYWQSCRTIPVQERNNEADETLNLISLASLTNNSPAQTGDLDELRALVSQVKQLQIMHQRLGSDPKLGRTWNLAVQCERDALLSQERLKLACSSETPKEPIAEALIIYLTQLKNNYK